MKPSQLTTEQLKEIADLLKQGEQIQLIAHRYDLVPKTLSSFLRKNDIYDLIKPKKEVIKYEIRFKLNANSFDEKKEYEKYVNKQIDHLLRNYRHIQVHQWSEYYIEKDKYVYTLYYLEGGTELSFTQSSLISVLKSAADEMCLLCKI